MQKAVPIHEMIDLTDPTSNMILNMSLEQARKRVASGDPIQVRGIDGHFALAVRGEGKDITRIRLARSLSVPMRYFVAKRAAGPSLVVAHRIDRIRDWLCEQGLSDQFHPTYTRMVPAHYITEIALLGCPDPNPTYTRYFAPDRESLTDDLDEIGRRYIEALGDEIAKWLEHVPADAPVGVCFSGGIDSGAVFLSTYHTMLRLGMNPARLKAFTLGVYGGGEDLHQSRKFLEAVDLQMFHEPIEVPEEWLDYRHAVALLEDYKPLDIQAGTMMSALCRAIRTKYTDWKYLLDGDGGDENLKDYPIEENPELTIRSVLNNRMLYHEGWGVDSIKHSLVYTGGLSRGCTRSFAPAKKYGFSCFSPFNLPNVIEIAEGIPFIKLTDWDHKRLYELKGEVVSRGVKAVIGMDMPIFEKRRFQHGVVKKDRFSKRFPDSPQAYRDAFLTVFHV